MRKISIIGVGRVGGALASALSKKGFVIENLVVRNDATARKISELIEPEPQISTLENLPEITSDIIFITTQDSEIETVAENLAGRLENSARIVFHTSGALSSDILKSLQSKGFRTGSIHPLVSISDAILGAERFSGAYFCVEGDPEAVRAAGQIVAELGGKSFSIETKYKALYHASAVTACGHLVALIDTATEMLANCGLSEAQAKEILLPLIKSTIENLEIQTPSEALTGTFARADVKTFEKHLAALDENVTEEAREIYLQLGARSAHLAERQGANAENLSEILSKISLAKKNFKC
jgi:predicted short-subunit dehydrogenase-like oxidoreductase (DUF2520 family)